MDFKPVNLQNKLSKFTDHWSPDEVFIVLDGEMSIEFRDGQVELKQGELFVVPKGVEHKPTADKECKIMLVEPAGTVNTGNSSGELTAEENVWI
jgi:mannose-6-phosphate isomerase-like protein (cupin superfamily)